MFWVDGVMVQNKLTLYPTTIWPGHVTDSSQVNSIINIANSYM